MNGIGFERHPNDGSAAHPFASADPSSNCGKYLSAREFRKYFLFGGGAADKTFTKIKINEMPARKLW